MGCVSRLFRKLWKNEKYVRVFLSIFWPSLILYIGCKMLWYAEERYSPVPIMTVERPETTGSAGHSEEDSFPTVDIDGNDSLGVEEDSLLTP